MAVAMTGSALGGAIRRLLPADASARRAWRQAHGIADTRRATPDQLAFARAHGALASGAPVRTLSGGWQDGNMGLPAPTADPNGPHAPAGVSMATSAPLQGSAYPAPGPAQATPLVGTPPGSSQQMAAPNAMQPQNAMQGSPLGMAIRRVRGNTARNPVYLG